MLNSRDTVDALRPKGQWWHRAAGLVLCLAGLSMSGVASPQAPQKPEAQPVTTPSGLRYTITKAGTGPVAHSGQIIVFQYVAKLDDGTVFDDSRKRHEPAAMNVDEPLGWTKGLQEGLGLMQAGESAVVDIPPSLAYGDKGNEHPRIPPNATLHFDIDVLAIKSHNLSDVLMSTLSVHGLKAARAQFEALKTKHFPDVYEGSGQLNYLGYGYLYRFNQFPEAIALFQWNVGLYPQSGDLEDSLAEAYFVSGDRKNALLHYHKALELQPDLKSSQKMVAKLKDDPASPTELQRLEMCLKEAAGFGPPLSEQPMNLPYLKERLQHYLATVGPNEATEAAKEVQLFLGVMAADKSQAQDAVYKQLGNSPLAPVRQVVALARETDRETAGANREIGAQLKKPIDLKFTALDGAEVDLAKLRGHVVLVEFWTAWSAASAKALTDISAAYDKYHGQGLEVVGVSLDQNPETATAQDKALKRVRTADEVAAFAKANSMVWPQEYDGKGWDNAFAKQYQVNTVPTFFLLDQNGVLAATDVRGPKLDEAVKGLLESPPAPLASAK